MTSKSGHLEPAEPAQIAARIEYPSCLSRPDMARDRGGFIQSGCDVAYGSVSFARRTGDDRLRLAEKVNELRIIPLGENTTLRDVVDRIHAKHGVCLDHETAGRDKLKIEIAYTPAHASSYSFSYIGKMPDDLEEASWFPVEQYWSC